MADRTQGRFFLGAFFILSINLFPSVVFGQTASGAEKPAVVKAPVAGVFAKASQRSERVTEALLNDEFRVMKEKRGWAYGYIPSQKGYKGWIHKDDILFTAGVPFKGKFMVYVRASKARLFLKNGSFIDVYAGTRLPLTGGKADQYEVLVPDGSTAFLPVESGRLEDETLEKVTPEDIMYAAEFLGSDYRWGGITAAGMDCSGFVYTVFRVNGILLRRDSYMQAEEGHDIPLSDLRKGDLLFFRTGKLRRISHVGIYVGHGKFIHSTRGSNGIVVSAFSDRFYKKNIVKARRILNADDDHYSDKSGQQELPAKVGKNGHEYPLHARN